jgi:uncharacterized protein (DUF1778 family)
LAMVCGMQTNDPPAVPGTETDNAGPVSYPAMVEAATGRGRRRRSRDGHSEMLRPRFTPAERDEVDGAAASAGMSTSRFCAEAALAAARGTPMVLSAAQDREALVRLQRQLFMAAGEVKRFGVNVNQAVAALNATGVAPEWMGRAMTRVGYSINQLDEVILKVDRRLR